MKKRIMGISVALVIVYALFCCLVYFVPQLFFYHPDNKKPELSHALEYDYPAREVHYRSADGTPLMAWYTPALPGKKMIVFMHGNSYNIEEFYYKLKTFAYDGYGTFLPEYRGFGGIKGKITQANLEADALAAVRYLHSLGYKNSDIYIYGMSLGSHMAINTVYQLQSSGEFAGLILEVPFDNLVNVVRKRVPSLFPLDMIVRDKYDNIDMISQISARTLIIGGDADTVVPVELAVNLYGHAAGPKKMIIYKNGKHGNLFNFRNDMDILNWIDFYEKSID